MNWKINTSKISNKHPKVTPKATRERKNKSKSQKKERDHKIRAEIKEPEMKETIEKINEIKVDSS